MASVREEIDRIRVWLIASDPGLLRFRTAATTTLTLLVSLGVLYGITKVFGQPITVALLGVVIAMLSSAAVNDPDPRQQRLTMLLLPLPATAAVTLGALLAPHKIAGDVVFVAVMFTAVYVRRFGSRGMALGMVAFMAYFFSLFLGATVSMLPWLIAALVIGTACSFVMRTYVLRERPKRVLALTLRALRVRTGAIVATVRGALAAGALDERSRRRLRGGVARLGETALLAESQLE